MRRIPLISSVFYKLHSLYYKFWVLDANSGCFDCAQACRFYEVLFQPANSSLSPGYTAMPGLSLPCDLNSGRPSYHIFITILCLVALRLELGEHVPRSPYRLLGQTRQPGDLEGVALPVDPLA